MGKPSIKSHLGLQGRWRKADEAINFLQKKARDSMSRALRAEAKHLVREMRLQLQTGGKPKFAPISSFTKAIRRAQGGQGGKPLVSTGKMKQSIKVKKISDSEYFAGIKRGEKFYNPPGRPPVDVVDIAVIHETGRKPFVLRLDTPSPVTGKTPRQWLWWLFFQGALRNPPVTPAGIMRIKGAEPRPFVTNVRDSELRDSGKRVSADFIKELNSVRVAGVSGSGKYKNFSFDFKHFV